MVFPQQPTYEVHRVSIVGMAITLVGIYFVLASFDLHRASGLVGLVQEVPSGRLVCGPLWT